MTNTDTEIKKLYYSISEVCKLTDLKSYVLRYWETEFRELKPPKNRAGNRTYRKRDIDTINKIKELKQFPISKLSNETIKSQIIKLADKMLSLNKRLNEFGDKKTDERARIEEEIKKTDKEIDELVYKLYDITEEEKKIIED